MTHLAEVYVCVCLHDNLKSVADTCFLLGSYVDWRKCCMSSHAKITDQRHFMENSRLLSNYTSYSVAGREILSPTALFSSYLTEINSKIYNIFLKFNLIK